MILLLLLAACSRTVPPDRDKITVAAYKGDVAALVYAAEDFGFFDQHGLDVEIVDFPSGRDASTYLYEKKADIATSAGFPFIINSHADEDLRIIGSISTEASINWLVSPSEDLESLNGQYVGVPKGTATEFLLYEFLTLNDVEVIMLDTPPNEVKKDVLSGKIAAGASWQPYLEEIPANWSRWSINSNRKKYFVLTAYKGWLDDNPEAAKRFVEALIDTEEAMLRRPRRFRNYAQEKFDLSDRHMEEVWPLIQHRVLLEQAMVLDLENQARYAIKAKYFTGPVPNYLDKIYFDALEEDRVTVIYET